MTFPGGSCETATSWCSVAATESLADAARATVRTTNANSTNTRGDRRREAEGGDSFDESRSAWLNSSRLFTRRSLAEVFGDDDLHDRNELSKTDDSRLSSSGKGDGLCGLQCNASHVPQSYAGSRLGAVVPIVRITAMPSALNLGQHSVPRSVVWSSEWGRRCKL